MTVVAVAVRPALRDDGELQPQEWYDVTAPPAAVARAAGALAASYGAETLATGELCELVATLATRSDLWRPLLVSDRKRRRYRLMFEDPRLDIWVLSWMPGQATGYHDHGNSNVALTALQGSVLERQIRVGRASIERELLPGVVRPGPAGYIHSVAHRGGAPAVTLHAYSPPLLEVGQYRAGAGEELLRERAHGRRELLDHTIVDAKSVVDGPRVAPCTDEAAPR
jgi:predicted metal-dependent enzyme (double-stranded beta helix superfamily)